MHKRCGVYLCGRNAVGYPFKYENSHVVSAGTDEMLNANVSCFLKEHFMGKYVYFLSGRELD